MTDLPTAWNAYRDGPDYTPTDRYPVRQVFDAGYEAGLRASQWPDARPDKDDRESLEAACLEGLVLTEHGYRYRPAKGANAILAAGWTRRVVTPDDVIEAAAAKIAWAAHTLVPLARTSANIDDRWEHSLDDHERQDWRDAMLALADAGLLATRTEGEDRLPRPASCGARICTFDSIGPHTHDGGLITFTPATHTADEDTRVALSDFIAEQRDQYPRLANDMDSEELVDAILAEFNVTRKDPS